jgi:DNA-directed RNA polymerase specialized sigma24 family protein
MDKRTTTNLLRFYANIDKEIRFKYELYGNTPRADAAAQTLKQLRADIASALDSMPYVKKDTLYQHYIKGVGWDKIRRRHWYSNRQIRNIANSALQELAVLLDSCKTVQDYLASTGHSLTS